MSFKTAILSAIVFLPFLCFSQDLERKGKFFFNIGPEYRITPFYRLKNYSEKSIYTNPDMQNSGVSINIGVDYYFTNNFSVGFKNSFRYDLVTSEIDVFGPSMGQTSSDSKKDLLIGYHFNLNYHFQIFRKGDLLVSAGLSLLNRNSEFTVQEPLYDNNQQSIGTVTYLDDFEYSANKISVGYCHGKSKLMLGMYITRNSVYFDEPTTFIVPFINYSYDFGKL